VQSFHHWRHYLLSQEFVLYSDHEALQYLNSWKKLSARHDRWIEFLQDYTYTLKHISIVENKVADALSRRVCFLKQLSAKVVCFERIKEEYESCSDFGEIVLKEGVTTEIDDFLLQDDYLFRFRKLCVFRTSLKDYLVWLGITCWRSCRTLRPRKDHKGGREFILLTKP